MTRQALPEPLHGCKRPCPAIPCESSPFAAIYGFFAVTLDPPSGPRRPAARGAASPRRRMLAADRTAIRATCNPAAPHPHGAQDRDASDRPAAPP